jgi:hypothetical protein
MDFYIQENIAPASVKSPTPVNQFFSQKEVSTSYRYLYSAREK